MPLLFTQIQALSARFSALLVKGDAIAFLLLRGWVAWVFVKSGYLKATAWDSTMYLFENEFQVPLLSPLVAAVVATVIELGAGSALMMGLGARFAAFVLFVFNIMAVVSYPDLGENGIRDHQVWGLMLLVMWMHGPAQLSIDFVLEKYCPFKRLGRKSA